MRNTLIVVGAIAVVSAACSVDAPRIAPPQDTCPKEISVKQALQVMPGGWESSLNGTTSPLVSVSVFDGHPSGKAGLVPDNETNANGRRVSTWTLAENGKRQYWISCGYDRTNIVLSRLIGPSASSAEVTYDLQVTIAGQPDVVSITLK